MFTKKLVLGLTVALGLSVFGCATGPVDGVDPESEQAAASEETGEVSSELRNGGIGTTWEHHIHLFLRRAATLSALLGERGAFREDILRHLEVRHG